jgi:hypothetical protein
MKIKETIGNIGSYLNNLIVVDQETMKPSHSKVFSWIGFIALTYAFLMMFQKDDSLFLVYGGLVFGNHLGSRWTNKSKGITADDGSGDNTTTPPK